MASPSNVFDFYDTYQYDVVNLNPGPIDLPISVDQQSLGRYLAAYGPQPLNTLRYIHFKNRSLVEAPLDFIPKQRQVQGPEGMPWIGFRLMDEKDPNDYSTRFPVIAVGEKYYLRLSGEEGSSLFSLYAPHVLPAAFNQYRSSHEQWSLVDKRGGGALLSQAPPLTKREIVTSVRKIALYFSSKGAVTNLHYDLSGRGAVVCMLTGEKRIQLWPPGSEFMKKFSPESHPNSRRSRHDGANPLRDSIQLAIRKSHEWLLEEGMCVYIPAGWWHLITSLADCTISTRFTVGDESLLGFF
jgi:hypothetical protein